MCFNLLAVLITKKPRHQVWHRSIRIIMLLDLFHVRFEFLGDFFVFRMMQVM